MWALPHSGWFCLSSRRGFTGMSEPSFEGSEGVITKMMDKDKCRGLQAHVRPAWAEGGGQANRTMTNSLSNGHHSGILSPGVRAWTHELKGPLWMLCWEEVAGGQDGSKDQSTGYCNDPRGLYTDYSSGAFSGQILKVEPARLICIYLFTVCLPY